MTATSYGLARYRRLTSDGLSKRSLLLAYSGFARRRLNEAVFFASVAFWLYSRYLYWNSFIKPLERAIMTSVLAALVLSANLGHD